MAPYVKLISGTYCGQFKTALFVLVLHVSTMTRKCLILIPKKVKKSATGGLKDSWQNEPLLTF